MRRLLPILLAFSACVCCTRYDIAGMFQSSGPSSNARFAQSSPHTATDFAATRNEYSFHLITDIHVVSAAPHLQQAVTEILADTSAEHFLVCLGDLTSERGHIAEVHTALEPFSTASWPVLITPGNHELYFGEWSEYSKYWPMSSFCLRVVTPSSGFDLFIFLDSANATLGSDQRSWLEDVLSAAQSSAPRHIIVFTHTNFFQTSNTFAMTGNFNVEEAYDLFSLFSRYGVDAVFSGHSHYYSHVHFRDVDYYTLNPFQEEKSSGSRYSIHLGSDISVEQINR